MLPLFLKRNIFLSHMDHQRNPEKIDPEKNILLMNNVTNYFQEVRKTFSHKLGSLVLASVASLFRQWREP